jgi:hypothetical protein
MANLIEQSVWEPDVYELSLTDDVVGGPDGISNLQAKQLTNRTAFLNNTKAPLASPALTGIPTVPTAAPGTNTPQIASTAFIQAAIAALVASSPAALDTLNELAAALGDDANFSVTMTNALALKAPLASPALTGTPTAPTAALGTNNTQLSTTAFVQAAIAALVASSPAALDTLNELAAALGNDANFAVTITNALALKAPLASPALTGAPTAPTPALRDKSTKLATTEFFSRLGIGMDLAASNSFTGDMNGLLEPGEYYYANLATNTPVAASFGLVKVWRESAALVYQFAQESNSGRIYTRKLSGGTWSAWAESAVISELSRGGGSTATNASATAVSTTISFTAPRAGRLYMWANGYHVNANMGLSLSASNATSVASNANFAAAAIGVASYVGTVAAGATVVGTASVSTSGAAGPCNIGMTYLFIPT